MSREVEVGELLEQESQKRFKSEETQCFQVQCKEPPENTEEILWAHLFLSMKEFSSFSPPFFSFSTDTLTLGLTRV